MNMISELNGQMLCCTHLITSQKLNVWRHTARVRYNSFQTKTSTRPHAISDTSEHQEGEKSRSINSSSQTCGNSHGKRWFPVVSNWVFVPWPATGEAARRFQEPGEECCKADLNLPSHRNCFRRGRALLRKWSSDRHLQTRVQTALNNVAPPFLKPPLHLK